MRQPRADFKFEENGLAVDLHVYWDRWEDPGDYPSNAGGGPLPPGPWYPEDVSGTVTIALTDEARAEIKEYPSVKEWVNDGQIGSIIADGDYYGHYKITWEVVLATDEKVIVEPEKIEDVS